MGNRVIIGRNQNTNTHGSGADIKGIFVARPGKAVTGSISKHDLTLNTDTVISTNARIDKGPLQIVPTTSAGGLRQDIQVSGDTTGAASISNIGSNHVARVYGMSNGVGTPSASSTTSLNINNPVSFTWYDTTVASTTQTYKTVIFKQYSTSSLW